MTVTVKRLPGSMAEVNATLEVADIQDDLTAAAARLAERTSFPGFRPGKAPYDVVKTKLGEMAIWNEAIEGIVRRVFVAAILGERLETVGSPAIDLKKFAPGNPIEFTASITVLPEVHDLPPLSAIRVKAKDATVDGKTVDEALEELRRMRRTETAVDRAATAEDKVMVDIAMSRDKVPLEGGDARDHGVYLAEPYYVPGFTAQLIGTKAGDARTFTLPFPETHYDKKLAGQSVDFAVTVKQVEALALPALDDAFAASLGQKSLADLTALLRKNLAEEAEQKEREREELDALDQLVAKAKFDDVPEKLVEAESDKMLHELEHSIASRGLEFRDYLAQIKKTVPELKLDFAPQAVKRVKTALAIRALAAREGVTADDAEVAHEVERTMNLYKDDPEAQARIRSEEYADILRGSIRNRKTIALLREQAVRE